MRVLGMSEANACRFASIVEFPCSNSRRHRFQPPIVHASRHELRPPSASKFSPRISRCTWLGPTTINRIDSSMQIQIKGDLSHGLVT
jgi:hypothetical protein